MVDPDSGWVSRAPPYSGFCWRLDPFDYAAFTLSGAPSQKLLLMSNFLRTPYAVLQPRPRRFGLLRVRSPLLAESRLISVPGLLRWFTSPSMTPAAYFIQLSQVPLMRRVTPFGYLRVSRICAPNRSFSQLITAFFVLQLLGIRHRPIFA